jgi:hypothetical protein
MAQYVSERLGVSERLVPWWSQSPTRNVSNPLQENVVQIVPPHFLIYPLQSSESPVTTSSFSIRPEKKATTTTHSLSMSEKPRH